MKNKGRRHIVGENNNGNGKSGIFYITRPIEKMSGSLKNRGSSKKWLKKMWIHRMRGYFKSQTKDLMNLDCEQD